MSAPNTYHLIRKEPQHDSITPMVRHSCPPLGRQHLRRCSTSEGFKTLQRLAMLAPQRGISASKTPRTQLENQGLTCCSSLRNGICHSSFRVTRPNTIMTIAASSPKIALNCQRQKWGFVRHCVSKWATKRGKLVDVTVAEVWSGCWGRRLQNTNGHLRT